MNDMNAFENQLGQVLQGAAGPSRPTDVAAMVSAATTPGTSRFSQLFGATKLAVAAGIVALFGGFVILGLLVTQEGDGIQAPGGSPSASPQATDALRALLTTEEVAPGIAIIADDGTDHLLTAESDDPEARGFDQIAVGPTGDVWLYQGSGPLFRLGQAGRHAADPYWEGGLEWLDHTSAGQLAALRGQGEVVAVAAETDVDPNVWFTSIDETDQAWSAFGEERLARIAPDAGLSQINATELAQRLNDLASTSNLFGYSEEVWTGLDEFDANRETCALAMASDQSVWAGVCGMEAAGGGGGLARYDGGAWEPIDPFDGSEADGNLLVDTFIVAPGANGTLWVAAWTSSKERLRVFHAEGFSASRQLDPEPFTGLMLYRLQGGAWSTHPFASVVGDREIFQIAESAVVDDAGRLWAGVGENIGVGLDGDMTTLPGSAALISFDGEQTRWHPSVGVVRDLGRHPDGSIWVAGAGGAYIIDPDLAHAESVAAPPGPSYAITDSVVAQAGISEVAPGVVRVDELNGVAATPGTVAPFAKIMTNTAGDVAFTDGSRLLTIDGELADTTQPPAGASDLELDGNGELWFASSSETDPFVLGRLGDEGWTYPALPERHGPSDLEIHTHGLVLAAWLDADGQTVVHTLENEEWQPTGQPIPGAIDSLHVTDGEVWVVQDGRVLNADWGDPRWRDLGAPPGDIQFIGVGGGSEAVAVVLDAETGVPHIAQLRERDWESSPLELEPGLTVMPGGPRRSDGLDGDARLVSDPYGYPWFPLAGPTDADGESPCAGLGRLDDGEVTRFLPDHCIGALEIVDDGSAWAQSLTDGSVYVIRP